MRMHLVADQLDAASMWQAQQPMDHIICPLNHVYEASKRKPHLIADARIYQPQQPRHIIVCDAHVLHEPKHLERHQMFHMKHVM